MMIRLLILGYGQLPGGELHPQTIARCLEAAAFELKRRLAGDKVVFYITTKCGRDGAPMGQVMKDYLLLLRIPEEQICFFPEGTNTGEEIDASLRHVKDGDAIGAVSSWYHVPRVALLFWKRGVEITWLEAAHGGTCFRDLWIEVIKYTNDLLNRKPMEWAARLKKSLGR